MRLIPTTKKPFRRRMECKTDYKQRLELLKSGKPRLVVRRTLNYIIAQIVKYEKGGDKTLIGTTSKELKKLGWKYRTDNLPAAYLTGLIIGKKAVEKNIKEAVLDIGLYSATKGARVFAVAKGAIDAGVSIPIKEGVLPDMDRIAGKHIADYIDKFKDMPEYFEKIKQKIIG